MNGKGANERVLFHGTSKESSDKIPRNSYSIAHITIRTKITKYTLYTW